LEKHQIYADFIIIMGAWNADTFCVTLGLLTILHAAYSAAQHRTYLRLSEQTFTSLPIDIVVQTLVGLALACYGLVQSSGSFKDIIAAGELDKKTWETVSNRPSFYSFNHRGKSLFGELEE
jgi:hypothetical protein